MTKIMILIHDWFMQNTVIQNKNRNKSVSTVQYMEE